MTTTRPPTASRHTSPGPVSDNLDGDAVTRAEAAPAAPATVVVVAPAAVVVVAPVAIVVGDDPATVVVPPAPAIVVVVPSVSLSGSVSLSELRRSRRITQTRLAAALGVTQSEVSRIERHPNPLVATVRAYAEAVGAELEVSARFDGGERIVLHFA